MTYTRKISFLFSIALLSAVFLFNSLAFDVYGQGVSNTQLNEVISAYRHYKDIDNINIAVPTVVEVPFDGEFLERFDFAVLNKESNAFEPYFFVREVVTNEIPVVVTTDKTPGQSTSMTDNNVRTYESFTLPEDVQGTVRILITGNKPITSSSLTVLLDNHVALPTSVAIRAVVDGQNITIVAQTKMSSQSIRFPKTTSDKWGITFMYSQPLRITELRLAQENATKTKTQGLRFLAQPDQSYRVYFDSDRRVIQSVNESGNLSNDKDVKKLSSASSISNPAYIKADVDKDGIPDILDNCVTVENSDQEDVDGNKRGDVCDDFDRDGLINKYDNCPNQPNRRQLDTDGDGIGDVCDGEESRITEKYKWIPWVGVGFAALVLIILFAITARSMTNKREDIDDSNETKEDTTQ